MVEKKVTWAEVAPEKGVTGERWVGKAGHTSFTITRPTKRHKFQVFGNRFKIRNKDFGKFSTLEEAQAKAERMA